jgi:clostripain
VEDINEMETVGSTDEVNIIVQMDRCQTDGYDESNGDWTGAKRFHVTQDSDTATINAADEVEDLGEVNMGDPETLIDFTTWAIDNYPSEKVALVLWDHGGAFWGICWDEDNEEDCITMSELKYAMAEIAAHRGKDIDLVGFDACLMAQLAVMYQIRDSVDIGVGSGYVEPGEGWPYEKILPRLVGDPEMSPKDLGTIIADEYVASYTDREEDPDDTTAVTQTVLDLEKYDQLAYQLDILAMIMSTKAGPLPGHHTQIWGAREVTNSYDFGAQYFPGNIAPVDPTGYCMYDLIDLMDNLLGTIKLDDDLRGAATAVKSATNDAILHFAVNPYHGNVKGAHGVTLYFPDGTENTYSDAYDEVDLAIDTYWDEFLHHYHDIENAGDTPPGVLITSPPEDNVVDKGEYNDITISGTAFDAQDTLSLIEIKVDEGEWKAVGASAQWSYDLALSDVENGEHTVYARSYDGSTYSAEDSVEFEVMGQAPSVEEGISPMMIMGAVVLLIIAALAALIFLKKYKSKTTS